MLNKERNYKIPPRKKNVSRNIESVALTRLKQKKQYFNPKKYVIETLLGEIKNCQIYMLTNPEKPTNKNIKNLLKKLNKNLKFLEKEKNTEKKILAKSISVKKTQLKNLILSDYYNDQTKNNKYLNNNKKINLINLKSEIELLKTLNFKAENDIKQINNMILKLSNDYHYLNLCMKYLSIDNKENLCLQPKYYPFISKVLHKQIEDSRSKYKLIATAKKIQNEEIESTKNDISNLKDHLTNIKKDNKEEIIEESKEYSKTFTLNKINYNINNIISKYNKKEDPEKISEKFEQFNDNVIIVDASSKSNSISDDFHSSLLSPSYSTKNKKNKKITIKNLIQPKINVNINLNLHFDKSYHLNEHMVYNSERNYKEKEKDNFLFLYNSKRKKGLSSTDSLPYLMAGNIKNSKKSSRNDKSKFKYKEFFDKNVSNSNEILNKEYLITY